MKAAMASMFAASFTAGCVPDGVVEQDLLNFDEALISVGCELRYEKHYQPLEFQTGLPREMVQKIAHAKVRRGDAVALEGGGFRSTVGSCAPDVNVDLDRKG